MACISLRQSIQWFPTPASESTQTVVLSSLKTGAFLDVRFDKSTRKLDWAFAGFRVTGESVVNPTSFRPVLLELGTNKTRFQHHIDSNTLDPLSVVDIGVNQSLPDGTILESGEMVNPETVKGCLYAMQTTQLGAPVSVEGNLLWEEEGLIWNFGHGKHGKQRMDSGCEGTRPTTLSMATLISYREMQLIGSALHLLNGQATALTVPVPSPNVKYKAQLILLQYAQQMHLHSAGLLLWLLILVSTGLVASQAATYDPSPFNFIGIIDAMTLDNSEDPLAGGTITVNNFHIVIPTNLLLTLPSITCAWSEMFDETGKPLLPLFLSEGVAWEATVWGNQVNGTRIAGLVYIAQQSVQSLQGFITSIDYTTGHFFIDNTEVVLNDPVGRFGPMYKELPLFTVDADNPSIRSSTGFPLCIPRNATDPECPLTNRPMDIHGSYLTSFTMPDPAHIANGSVGLDPRIMVPLVVGDYVTYSGTKVPGDLLAIYSLEANIGIFTTAGTQPAYITCAAAQYGIVVPDPTVETGETRATSLSTDPGTTVQWFAIDIDPCTGEQTERNLELVQPSSKVPIGRSVFRLGKVDASPATRYVGFRYSNGVVAGPRGIIAGQFIQPIFDYIFPELVSFGSPELPNQFDLIPYLSAGGGPLVYGNYLAIPPPTPLVVGQLDPWPGFPRPTPISCPPTSTQPSASNTPSSTATGSVDIITILSVTTRNQKGMTMITVVALTNSDLSQLSLSVVGADIVKPQLMTPLGFNEFTLTIATKGKPTAVIVTSSYGGSATQNT
ncbi:hypothetical protein MIND_00941400 [Mycena indigotica]|uniref:Uncharacterized protein n=1 Tax=Mycena indigotica TaxID=2126181 RepID=A0A8H6SFV4_9AGAR|nr:uncharacterized protein MIND_00941400 [Mycena indigotica]KAF7297085.1 hypothetical protein MIND_00941400 [Mycena indigotica]